MCDPSSRPDVVSRWILKRTYQGVHDGKEPPRAISDLEDTELIGWHLQIPDEVADGQRSNSCYRSYLVPLPPTRSHQEAPIVIISIASEKIGRKQLLRQLDGLSAMSSLRQH